MNPLGILWYFLPAFIANMTPVFVRRVKVLDVPVDFGVKLGKERLFGEHKTWRGLMFGAVAGMLTFLLQQQTPVPFALFDYQQMPWTLGLLLGLGALLGDLAKSFVKRRIHIKPGRSWVIFDQIDYIVGGLLFGSWAYVPAVDDTLFLLASGIVLTIIVNYLGTLLGLRKGTWKD